jgi:hypothetical protein
MSHTQYTPSSESDTRAQSVQPRRSRVKVILTAVVIAILTVVIAVIAAGFWIVDPLYLRAPKDAQIIRVFNEQREPFEKLSALALEDSSKGPWFSESWLNPLLGDERKRMYRDLLKQIRPGLVVGTSKTSVKFIFVSTGIPIGPGWFKGLARITDNPTDWGIVVDDLDQPRTLSADTLYLRRIAPNWYVVFEHSS